MLQCSCNWSSEIRRDEYGTFFWRPICHVCQTEKMGCRVDFDFGNFVPKAGR